MTPRQRQNRTRQKQINILHTNTRQRHSQKQLVQIGLWCAVVVIMILTVGLSFRYGLAFVLDHVLYNNSRYALKEIDIEPHDRFSPSLIRQAAKLEIGQNLWSLNLPQIVKNLEKLSSVSTARVERHFPDKLTITLHERVPMVRIVGINIDLGTSEPFYLDRDGFVLKPRENEPPLSLPEVIGLTDAELEPGTKLDRPILAGALQILDAIDHSKLHTSIDINTINLSNPLAITMVTSQNLSVTFRPDHIDQQMSRLEQIFDYAGNRTLRTVDLTPNYNVPVTFRE